MNHIYRLVRSRVTGLMIAVSELAKTPGVSATRGQRFVTAALLSTSLVASVAGASPTGGSVVAGNASIATNGSDTTINQTTQSAILNWQSFDISSNESVRFLQPNASSIALNRVLGADATQIMGNLSSNGRIFLINPHGVLFGQSAQVNVGGLVASARNISDDDFLSGRFYFSGSSDAIVANYGSITATDGGYVALLGAQVNNQGMISARLGSIALAAGDAFTLDTAGDGLLNVAVNAGAIRSLVDNGGLLQANGGQVVMTARSASVLVQSVVNNTGVVQAQTIENRDGVIKLLGDMESGVVNVGGQLDASAPNSGDGGFVDTSAAHVVIAPDAQVTTLANNGATGNWLIDPVDFTIAASGGDITGATLSAALTGSNVTILSSSGASGVNGDINVNDTVTWSSNLLTLSAYNNININTAMMGSGTASLSLLYGQGAVAAGNTSTVNVNAPVNLAAGNNFSTQLGSNGAVVNYTVITNLGAAASTTGTDLQGINGNVAGNYVLGANIDATATSGWNAGAGFTSIGTDPSRFTGNFDGLGHTISGLTINRTGSNFTGLFGFTATGSTVRNVGLLGGSVTSDSWGTGALVGALGGSVYNSYATTSMNGFHAVGGLVGVIDGGLIDGSHASGTVTSIGNGEAGGLVGLNWGNPRGTVRNSYATGNVSSNVGNVGGLMGINWGTITNSYATGTATGGDNYVGGLVGNNSLGTVNTSYATGAVSGVNYVGGLVGNASNTVSNSYATGAVSGTSVLGGLAGMSNTTLSNNYATGNVTATGNFVGGLVGSNSGTITGSYARGTVSGLDQIAGLVGGHNNGSISLSFASGDVIATTGAAGGLVGYSAAPIATSYASGNVSGIGQVGGILGAMNGSSVTDSYATGNVSGTSSIGGAIGNSTNGTITRAYSGGAVSGTTNVGGLLGSQTNATVTNSYWNTTTSGQASSAAGTGLTTLQLQASLPTGFSSPTWGNANNRTTPYLLNNMGTVLIDTDATATYYNVVSTLTQLQNINANLAGRYALINDIDASTTSGWNSGQGFVPLGNNANSFSGSFDGMGHIISSLTINRPTTDDVGLFGSMAGATVIGLGVVNANITGQDRVGTVFGATVVGSAEQIYGTGQVAGRNAVGGLIGYSNTTVLSSSYATASVSGVNSVGGLIGETNGGVPSTFNYATGNVTASGRYAGGLVGYNGFAFLISNSYATGNVSGVSEVGGLVGYHLNGEIAQSYSTGSVTGTSLFGGLVGVNDAGTVNNSYWNTTTSGQATSGGGTGLTAAQMLQRANFTGWDFTNTWIGYDGLSNPLLRTFMTALTVTANDATKTYDGQAYNGSAGVTYSTAPNMGNVLGTLTITGGTTNAGVSTTTASGLYSHQQGYAITYVGGTLTVNKAVLTATASAGNKTYDGTTTANATLGSFSGLVGTETIGASATATFNSKDVATANLVTVTGVTLSNGTNGGLANNYTLASGQTASANITTKALTATASAVNKVYDGATTASATLGSLTGLIGTETVAATATAATFNTKDVATATTVTVNSASLADGSNGGLASNYSLASGQTASANITAKALTATASAGNKVYDGSTTASATLGSLTGLIGTETVGATATTATFNTKDVATATTVTVNSASLVDGTNGGLATNYSISSGQTTGASITAKALTATASAGTKVYDGGATASATLGSITGLVGTETVGATATAATFNTKDVSTATTVTVNTASLADGSNGGLASNYSLATGQTASANITAKALTATASANNKVYDGTTAASATLGSVTGLVGTETIGTSATASFNSKDVATANLVTVSGVTLSDGMNGGLASNYSLATGQTASASITTKALTAVASASNKVYDGTTSATATLGSLTGLVGTETVVTTATATFNAKDVVTANQVTVNGVTLADGTNGGLASNYSLASGQTASANITQRVLTASAFASDKVYDGTTSASATLGSLTGLVGTETVGTTAAATFNAKDVVTANQVTVNSATLSDGTNGGLASNYSLASGQTASANITQKALTATASAMNKVYDGETTANATLGSLTGLVGSETINSSTTAAFNSKDVATANVVTVSGVTLADGSNGGLASNYSLASGQTASANITQRALTATASATNKVYDGTNTASATLGSFSGLIGTETINASATAAFNSKDVAAANLVTVNGVTLSSGTNGGLASNYSLASGQTASANITQRALTATASASSRVYDGTTAANATLGSITGLVGAETIDASTTATFNTKDVATANLVTVNAVTLANGTNGGLASNYSIASGQTANANITQRALSATAAAATRVYDGTANAAATFIGITGFVSNETVVANVTGQFNSKDVATANLVTINGVTLSDGVNGGLASNYSLVTGQTAAATITARALTVAGASALDRVYDGTTAATITGGALVGVVTGENVSLTRIGSFATPFVGQQIPVASSSVLNGADAVNYTLIQPTGLSANIFPVINAANFSNGVSPAAAYESARAGLSPNTSIVSSAGASTSFLNSSFSHQNAGGASTRNFSELNLTIIGTGLNAPEWTLREPEDDRKLQHIE